ncbi:MAG: hypothetical protein E6933_07985 [Clostridiales bacterium]|jgi:hypothetical protein|nr:hypothetical protein [Clostridiales bacterium]
MVENLWICCIFAQQEAARLCKNARPGGCLFLQNVLMAKYLQGLCIFAGVFAKMQCFWGINSG